MSKAIEIIKTAVAMVYGPGENPLDEAPPEKVINFFNMYTTVLADPVIKAFEDVYPPEFPDEQIPQVDRDLFNAAWDARI